MIRDKEDRTLPEAIEINLTGPEGNAFSLLSVAKDLAHINKFSWDKIYTEMTKSDYENLIQVMDNYFGDQIILQR
jgi:hypothetical protein